MIIYPYIALRGGRCVNLIRGRIDEPVAYDVDPIETARGFAHAGAEWMQVVDLDAVAGTGSNEELIRDIIIQAGAPVMVSGGIRSMEKVRHWADAGAGRIVIGTAAAKFPDLVTEAAHSFPDQIVVSIDVWQGYVTINGWREQTVFKPVDFVHKFSNVPLSQIIVTDIDRDLSMPESSMALVSKIASETATPVIASGLARSLDDISELKYLYNIAGAVVGRALYEGAFTLQEAIEVAKPAPEKIAAFI